MEDGAHEVEVSGGVFELPRAQIHAAGGVAVRTMTGDAGGGVDAGAGVQFRGIKTRLLRADEPGETEPAECLEDCTRSIFQESPFDSPWDGIYH